MENKIRIRFELVDEGGNRYCSDSAEEVFRSLGETDLDVIGRQFNVFLKQCGYSRENDYIFMEDITEEEYDELADFLNNLRNGDDSDDD